MLDMVKLLHKGSFSNAWLLSTFLSLFLVSILHSSSASLRSFSPSTVPDEALKKIIINALQKEWKGFKFPKSARAIRPFYNIISPMDEVEVLMDSLKQEEDRENEERIPKNLDGRSLSNYEKEEQDDDQFHERKISRGGEGARETKYIYRVKDSFPKLNKDEWEIEIPTGTRSAQQWKHNGPDEGNREIEGNEENGFKNEDEEENSEQNLPNYLSVAEMGEKRTKRGHFLGITMIIWIVTL
ncbi:hypothetical protein Anas_08180 [Armadillidium nasatum]|uniref:Uncharacterized protein n=1 Tax=Armadillidium nasatum TaxID=96803 RepID=A0A5N5TL08_9CRUS|nr:hypothetical protein Anas_08180 [Armadillidium nasatum]